jgi:hypothetical protein
VAVEGAGARLRFRLSMTGLLAGAGAAAAAAAGAAAAAAGAGAVAADIADPAAGGGPEGRGTPTLENSSLISCSNAAASLWTGVPGGLKSLALTTTWLRCVWNIQTPIAGAS